MNQLAGQCTSCRPPWFQVLAFIPQDRIEFKTVGEEKRAQRVMNQEKPARLPDNIQSLVELASQGYLVTVPPQDYDDSYIIRYAQEHDGIIVSTDLYRDYIKKAQNVATAKKWIRSHLISFTFVKDEFLPNPDFIFPQHDSEQQQDVV